MRRSLFSRLIPAALLLALAALFAAPALAEPRITLRFTSAYMERHPAYLNAFVPWMHDVQDKTAGRVQVQYFLPNTICPEAGMFDAVSAGAVDVAANAHGRTPGRFPLMGVFDLPMLMPDSETGSVVMQQLYDERQDLQKESAGVPMLWHYMSAPHVLHTKIPVTSLDDLKGLKIIVWAPMGVDIIKALGGTPISSVPHDSYMALQRGMADGVLCPLSTLRSFKISEAVSHTTTVPLMLDSFWVAMSPDMWQKLPADVAALINESALEMPRKTGHALDEGANAEMSALMDQGHHFHDLSPEETTRWREALSPIYDEWLGAMKARGLTQAEELLQLVQARMSTPTRE